MCENVGAYVHVRVCARVRGCARVYLKIFRHVFSGVRARARACVCMCARTCMYARVCTDAHVDLLVCSSGLASVLKVLSD